MDDREDGEVSGSDCDLEEKIYIPIVRPVHPHPSHYRNSAKSVLSSDEDDDSSDSDFGSLPKRKKMQCSQMEIEGSAIRNGTANIWRSGPEARKKNNIWANVLEEEELTKEIGGVGLKKLNTDRDVESYDYTQALILHNKPLPPESDDDNDAVVDSEEKESLEDISKRLNRKRRVQDRVSDRRKLDKQLSRNFNSQRELDNIKPDPSWTDEELGCVLADALHEYKPELIVKVVEIVGQETALRLYTATQDLEKEGGLMILNGERRRTSGGVFLHLLKTFEGVEKEHLAQIFTEDTKSCNQWRKRKRMNRRRKHDSKGQALCDEKTKGEGLQLQGLFCDDPGGTKCPGSTPVTTPQGSDEEGKCHTPRNIVNGTHPLPMKEVCEKAAFEIFQRDAPKDDTLLNLHTTTDDMDVV